MSALNAVYYTVEELVKRGKSNIPTELISSDHLIYSSPATLAFNSPGAEGFGVKRAGLTIPGSVMLIVSPGCCGRNTSAISRMPGYEDRFFYLTMDETDLVTGRHLTRIPDAVERLCQTLRARGKEPSVVMICITCVDALLGTDMERVCRRAEEQVGVRVRPCYMYALTREGSRPPMVHVRESLYSLLEKRPKKSTSVNIMGYFAPLDARCELPKLLRQIGVKEVRELSACRDYEEFLQMAEANFNLVLNPESRFAADDLEKRLQMPYIELYRMYEIDRIDRQYEALAAALGVKLDREIYKDRAKQAMMAFRAAYPKTCFAVGEATNADAFEMALALVRYGFSVAEVYGTVTEGSYVWLQDLAELSPHTRVYSNLHPTMLQYRETVPDPDFPAITITIGKDASYYHPSVPNLQWGQDRQPFGFAGVELLFEGLMRTMQEGESRSYRSEINLGADARQSQKGCQAERLPDLKKLPERRKAVKGYRQVLTPFAPDQSGAVSVLYALGGLTVICDAGGCTGNICGFDEPRWFEEKSAVFSAGLRDMDAIMGRDDRLVKRLKLAAEELPAKFAALIGTPVPSVIATDFRALERMAERQVGLPAISVPTTGMGYYDVGASAVYVELLKKFCAREPVSQVEFQTEPEAAIGVWGANPIDLGGSGAADQLRSLLREEGLATAYMYGMGAGLEEIKTADRVRKNLVVTVSGYAAAKWLYEKYGIEMECRNPLAKQLVADMDYTGKRVLLLQEQITANSMRELLEARGAEAVVCATFFQQRRELSRACDVRFREECDVTAYTAEHRFDVIYADPAVFPLIEDSQVQLIPVHHFAVSG